MDLGEWRAVDPGTGAAWFSLLSVPWWFSGGWALDLHVGEQIRDHDDLDVGVLRRDISTALAALSGWEISEAKDGALTPVQPGDVPRFDAHSLWCRPSGTVLWTVELLLDECVDNEWVYRRHEAIRRPLSSIVHRNPAGLPYLAPEIQLLYKARGTRSKDQADFERITPRLSRVARAWLLQGLERAEPEHPWISVLRRAGV